MMTSLINGNELQVSIQPLGKSFNGKWTVDRRQWTVDDGKQSEFCQQLHCWQNGTNAFLSTVQPTVQLLK
jgi:hypothetical protein